MDKTFECSHSNSIENISNKQRNAMTPTSDIRSPNAKQINSITFVNPPTVKIEDTQRKSVKVNFYGDQEDKEASNSVGKPTATNT